jgi:hypothetical protein
MNVSEVTTRIKALPLFKDLILMEASDESQFGTITVPPRHFKDSKKNEIKLSGIYNLFVAHMYKDGLVQPEFFYLTFYHKGEQRDFRRQSFNAVEYNKIFASGMTVDKIISDLEEKLIGYSLK